ncbi:MAG: head GIN domain-containing protein [Saprospiraceae bacterium]
MKNLMFVLATLLMLNSCTKLDDSGLIGIKGEGPVLEFTVEPGTFDGIRLETSGEVYLTDGDEASVTVFAQENIFENMDIRVEDKLLYISNDKLVRKSEKVRIYISRQAIARLALAGSGDIFVEGAYSFQNLDLDLSGSGDVQVESATANNVNTTLSGSGNVSINGKALTQHILIEGSGDVLAFGLETESTTVKIKRSGKAEVWATENLVVDINGSGDVIYKGTPAIQQHITGSGNLSKAP